MTIHKRAFVAATTISLIAVSLVAGILLFNFAGDQEAISKLYTYPVSVGEETHIITVRTNWTSEPKVYLSNSSLTDPLKYVSVDFMGSSRETVFFNITIPTDLFWGNISLVWKYYEQNPDRYTLSNNGTHNSVEVTFTHIATIEYFEIRGTEGAW
jgi:hypothetical protein